MLYSLFLFSFFLLETVFSAAYDIPQSVLDLGYKISVSDSPITTLQACKNLQDEVITFSSGWDESDYIYYCIYNDAKDFTTFDNDVIVVFWNTDRSARVSYQTAEAGFNAFYGSAVRNELEKAFRKETLLAEHNFSGYYYAEIYSSTDIEDANVIGRSNGYIISQNEAVLHDIVFKESRPESYSDCLENDFPLQIELANPNIYAIDVTVSNDGNSISSSDLSFNGDIMYLCVAYKSLYVNGNSGIYLLNNGNILASQSRNPKSRNYVSDYRYVEFDLYDYLDEFYFSNSLFYVNGTLSHDTIQWNGENIAFDNDIQIKLRFSFE